MGVVHMFKFSFAIVLAIPFSALAQTSELPAAASVSATPVAAPLVVGQQLNANLLRAGTEIRLRTLTELGSKTSRVSERFNLEVTEDVRLNGQIVIPVGTRGVGEVTKVTNRDNKTIGKVGQQCNETTDWRINRISSGCHVHLLIHRR